MIDLPLSVTDFFAHDHDEMDELYEGYLENRKESPSQALEYLKEFT